MRSADDGLQPFSSDEALELLLGAVSDYAIYMLDRNGCVVTWNTGAERIKGYPAAEIIGQHFSRFFTAEDRARGLPATVLASAAADGRFESEGWRVRKDGSRFWCNAVVHRVHDDRGRLVGFAKITRDITERRAAQQALLESERRFRLLVDGAVDYAIYMLDPGGIVVNWNHGAERMKGYAVREIVGQHFSRFYTDEERAAGRPAQVLETAAREGRFEADGWRVRKDGSRFWASVVVDAIRDESGQLVGFAKITRDITERRDAQLALQEAQAQRAQAQKIEALGQLTGGVAHDFNNLLMIVLGQAEFLKRRIGGDSVLSRAVEAIELAAQRGSSLTRQLLTFARRQSINPKPMVLHRHIDSFVVMLKSSIGSSTRLVTEIPEDCWPITVDPGEFELALVNLALNARDAMTGGGTVVMRARNVTLATADTPAGLAGDFVALDVADTGAGIAPDLLGKVFDPFFTTKEVGKGTGLGLSQVHGFAHQSGGTVMLCSELGKGTTVTLYLPRGVDAEAKPEPPAEPGDGQGRSVLLVEDNPDVAKVARSMLEQLGYAVRHLGDGAAALAAIEAERFDLVVSDVVMAGGLDGLGLARALRARRPDLPVLLLTGYSEAAARIGGEFAVLRKPFALADLSRAAARLIANAGQPPGGAVARTHGSPMGSGD